MLASVNAATGGIFAVPLSARVQSHSAVSGIRIKNRMSTGPLRATGATSGALGGRTASPSGGGILSQFNTQGRSASPLTAGVRTIHRSKPASSTGVM